VARIDIFDFPDELFYDRKEHMWIRPAGDGLVTLGIDDGGQDALGDVVYLQLGEAGRRVASGEAVGTIEAEKMVRPLIAPVSGTLREVNTALSTAPRAINQDPYGSWLYRIETSHWESEKARFLHGAFAVSAWVGEEIESHRKP
jgi:glycine cleavage system H protein